MSDGLSSSRGPPGRGRFDRIPASLRLCFAHGGGSFPFWVGRMDNAWHQRPDVVGTSPHPPSHYLDRFSVDTVVFDERALRLLVETMGGERVMLGSDYPYPFGERPAGDLIRKASFLDQPTRQRLLGGNAAAFLGGGPQDGRRVADPATAQRNGTA